MIDKEEWTEVETSSPDKEENKVEFEIEEEVKAEAPSDTEPEEKVEVKEEKPQKLDSVEKPQELDGIETKGAQKRIRQLIKQRKDRDDQISQLVRQNEELTGKLVQENRNFPI